MCSYRRNRLERILQHYPAKFELSRDAFWAAPFPLLATLVNQRVGSIAALLASTIFWLSSLLLVSE